MLLFQHAEQTLELSHWCFFAQDELYLDTPVTSSRLYAHVPLQGGLSLLPTNPPPEKRYSPLLLTFLNITYSHMTEYVFYFIFFVVCLPSTKCK